MSSWAEANGIELPQGGFGGRGGGGDGGPFANLSEEERNNLREELRNMTPEQRQARFAELGIQVGDGQGRGQGGPRGGGRFGLIMEPMIELLSTRATP